jgi:hypothetical protein
MTKILLDKAARAKFDNLREPTEVCDDAGRTLGVFVPSVAETPKGSAPLKSPYSEEEIQRRRRDPAYRDGKTWEEIRKGLAQLSQQQDPK